MAKRQSGRDLWDSLVEAVQQDDGLPTFTYGGEWTIRKLFFVCQYLEQVTRGIKGNRNFPGGITYVDLFCGTGVSVVPGSDGRPRRYPGSPLIAASTPKPFDRLILCDKDPTALDAVQKRIRTKGFTGQVATQLGDVNTTASSVARLIPTTSLNVAFVDPYSLDVHYETIKTIASTRALDLIILFSDRFDLGRNVHKYYGPKEEDSKLDAFLGYSSWRQEFANSLDHSGQAVRQFFATVYLRQLAQIGYIHSKSWPLRGPNGDAYRLIFASKHPLGLKYCEIALGEDWEGNRGLFGT